LKCNLRNSFARSETTFGTWVTIGSTDIPDMLEEIGFDWLVFDTEHGPLTQNIVSSMIQSIDSEKVCPIVRVGSLDMYYAKSYLDMGAHGILFPLINTAEEAEKAVSYCKYPPEGVRGTAPRKASSYGIKFSDYVREANKMTIVGVQIETKRALENLEDIASVKGVDILFVGPTDLTMSLGLFDERNNQKVKDAMRYVINVCKRKGKIAGILAVNEEEALFDIKLGFSFVGLSSDFRIMLNAAKDFLEKVKRR
jgi:2-keto-3-deoxy-L-rhamnonate aldolase RhmA